MMAHFSLRCNLLQLTEFHCLGYIFPTEAFGWHNPWMPYFPSNGASVALVKLNCCVTALHFSLSLKNEELSLYIQIQIYLQVSTGAQEILEASRKNHLINHQPVCCCLDQRREASNQGESDLNILCDIFIILSRLHFPTTVQVPPCRSVLGIPIHILPSALNFCTACYQYFS